MGTKIFKPYSSGTLRVLPTPTPPNTKVTVVVQNVPLGAKVALSGVLQGLTYGNFETMVQAGATIVAQELGTRDRSNMAQAQVTITEHDHPGATTVVYRSTFAQQNPVTSAVLPNQTENPLVPIVVPFSASTENYYRIDAELYRLKVSGALRILSVIAS